MAGKHRYPKGQPGDATLQAVRQRQAGSATTANLRALTQGSFRADLVDVFGDAHGHVTAMHQITATRNDTTRVSKGAILFTFLGARATDLLEMHADLPGDDAFSPDHR